MILYPISRPFALLALLLLAGPLLIADYSGEIVGVFDGSTLTLLISNGDGCRQAKVHLA